MGTVNHEQANLILKLYDLRREPKLREARAWFVPNFWANSYEEVMQKFPAGSAGNTHFRMVIGYWEMAASMVNRGLVEDEFFFENNGEMFWVWDRIRGVVPSARAMQGNPRMFAQLEAAGTRMEKWWNTFAPGYIEAQRKRFAAIRDTTARPAGAS
ncbi:MAG: DUF4760 domain-containing protein [Bryobacteraceae bacterium]